MAYIGATYRFVYEARELRSGLTDVTVVIFKPDATIIGPFPMMEMPTNFFSGLYTFSLTTSADDPVGEYVYRIFSPSENLMEDGKVTIESNSTVDTTQSTSPSSIIGYMRSSVRLRLRVSPTLHLKAIIMDPEAVAAAASDSETLSAF